MFLLNCDLAVFAQNNIKIDNFIQDDAGKLFVINYKNNNKKTNYKIMQLDNPARTVIDIADAVLIGQKRSIDCPDAEVKNIRIAQFSTDPDIVRLVFTADSEKNLKELVLNKSQNTLIFKLNNVEVQRIGIPTVYKDKDIDNIDNNNQEKILPVKNNLNSPIELKDTVNKNSNISPNPAESDIPPKKPVRNIVINTIKYVNDHILLSGTGTIAVKEPLILQNPGRIVFDIPNSLLVESKELLKTFVLNNHDTVRIGQFDPETSRIVIETNNPNNYKTIISPDLQSILITPKDKINFSELPNSKIPAEVEDIKILKKDERTTIITLTLNNPVIHNIKHLYNPNKANLELFNAHAPDKSLIANLPETKQFRSVKINPIEEYPNGSSWIFALNKNTKFESKLGIDGKKLEIILKDPVYSTTGMSKYKVVIDPGHGGCEPGAQRDGISEKDITLDVAQRVVKYLTQSNINIVMTRNEDSTVSLKQRTDITNLENPDVFVSIHVNACEASNVKGIETHWYTKQSELLALEIQNKLANAISTPDRGIKNSMFYVIHHTNVPAVLVEIGFLSNDAERFELLTEERKELTAKAIANGILKYLKSLDICTNAVESENNQ
ncbi:MAG: N-acetylmuramoyl-L-alanine amidase [bacterium]